MNNIELLKYYDNLYFNEGTSPLTDTEYDLLRSQTKKEFPNDPYFLEVGNKIDSKYEEIKLPFVIGGLDKVDIETVEDWIRKERGDVVASEKLDGNSIICSWKNHQLILAASRGDGQKGQNILNKIKYAVHPIPIKEKVTLRGEVLLEGEVFKELGFKNRRNAVTGMLRRDEIDPNILKKLSVIFYEVIEAPKYYNLDNEVKRFIFISDILKLKIPIFATIEQDCNIPLTLSRFLIEQKEFATYDIDGLVLTRYYSTRENTMHPINKVKFKVNELAKRCVVIGIEWNVTRMGYIKPVILIEPVDIMGVTVSRVSGFNLQFIVDNGIDKESVIGVVRSGDVIPYVTEVFERAETIIPDKCPDCNGSVKIISKELICTNPKCFHKNVQEVAHFFIEMGVDGMSDKTIENIGITSIKEMYLLTRENISKLPGFGEKKAEIIVNEVQKTLRIKPEKLLASFGIPLIGKTLSKQLCSRFTIDELFNIKDPDKLGLGPITSKSLIDNIVNYKELYNFLKSIGLQFLEENMEEKTLKGFTFSLTGEGPMKRSEIQKLIEKVGGEVKGIGRGVNYLVTNDPNSTSGKMKSAAKFGVSVISYDTLFKEYLMVNID